MKAKRKYEVEVKAWVLDSAALEKKVGDRAKFEREMTFRDTYFTYADKPGYQIKRFRVRRSEQGATVTAKQKLGSKSAETSRELEFKVEDFEAFREFAEIFDFRVMVEKVKVVRRYKMRAKGNLELNVDLVKIERLGEFIEIEALVDSKDKVIKAEDAVRSALLDFGLTEEDIEPTPYTLLLYNRLRMFGRV